MKVQAKPTHTLHQNSDSAERLGEIKGRRYILIYAIEVQREQTGDE